MVYSKVLFLSVEVFNLRLDTFDCLVVLLSELRRVHARRFSREVEVELYGRLEGDVRDVSNR